MSPLDQTDESLWVDFPGGARHWAGREASGLFCRPTEAQLKSRLRGPVGELRLGNVLDIKLESALESSGSQGQFLGSL